MKLLEQFISQTGKQPTDWTSADIQEYLDYIKAHVTEVVAIKRYDN
jgi:hypothetical protein